MLYPLDYSEWRTMTSLLLYDKWCHMQIRARFIVFTKFQSTFFPFFPSINVWMGSKIWVLTSVNFTVMRHGSVISAATVEQLHHLPQHRTLVFIFSREWQWPQIGDTKIFTYSFGFRVTSVTSPHIKIVSKNRIQGNRHTRLDLESLFIGPWDIKTIDCTLMTQWACKQMCYLVSV